MQVILDTKYLNGTYTVRKAKYIKGNRIALFLISEGLPVCTASVNLPEIDCPDGCVWIKNYAENEGIKDALIEAGVIGPVIKAVNSGFVTFTLHKVLIP